SLVDGQDHGGGLLSGHSSLLAWIDDFAPWNLHLFHGDDNRLPLGGNAFEDERKTAARVKRGLEERPFGLTGQGGAGGSHFQLPVHEIQQPLHGVGISHGYRGIIDE